MEEFLTVAQVAERLKLNQQTVRNWIDAGTLPAYRVGRRVRVSQADFDRLVAASYTGSRSGDDERGGQLPESQGTIWDGVIAPPMVLPNRGSAAPDDRGAGLETVATADSPSE
jgi:excisionase family DNA binding protein